MDDERDFPTPDVPAEERVEAAFKRLETLRILHPEDAHVVWRAARAYYDLACLDKTPKEKKKSLLEEAHKLIERAKATEAGRNIGHVYRWAGIILSEMGSYSSTEQYIKNAFVIREEWEQATYINPYDASALHLLGRWCFDVANMSWVKRKVAATLFAEPPSASMEEAYSFFKRAEDINPGFWKANSVMLAKTCVAMGGEGRKEEALKWLQEALKLPVLTSEDASMQKEALQLLKGLDSAKFAEENAKEQARLATQAGGKK